MQLYFIRHAQSANNQLWSDTGSADGRSDDPGITDLGIRQARALADFLEDQHPIGPGNAYDTTNVRGIRLTHLYTSLNERAVRTGALVADQLDLPLVGLMDAHECGGIYIEDESTGELIGQPGKTPGELKALTPRLVLPEINPAGWWNRPFEPHDARISRAYRLMRLLLELHSESDDQVGLFSHAAFFNYFLAAVVGLDQRPAMWAYMNNTGISRFDFYKEEKALIYTNRIDHLTSDLLT